MECSKENGGIHEAKAKLFAKEGFVLWPWDILMPMACHRI